MLCCLQKSNFSFLVLDMEKLNDNQVVNIANNYGFLYGIYTIHEELKALLKLRGNNKYFVYKLLCRSVGRVLGDGSGYFRAEMNYDQDRRLFEDINKSFIIKVLQRKRYTDDGDMCITFIVYS